MSYNKNYQNPSTGAVSNSDANNSPFYLKQQEKRFDQLLKNTKNNISYDIIANQSTKQKLGNEVPQPRSYSNNVRSSYDFSGLPDQSRDIPAPVQRQNQYYNGSQTSRNDYLANGLPEKPTNYHPGGLEAAVESRRYVFTF